MKGYQDLEIFREARELAIRVHTITLSLPSFELYEEGGQLRRSSKSVAAMITEGYGRRRYKADCIKHLIFAVTECDESLLHLEFLYETGSLKDEMIFKELSSRYIMLGKKINKFIQWAEGNLNEFPIPQPETSNRKPVSGNR